MIKLIIKGVLIGLGTAFLTFGLATAIGYAVVPPVMTHQIGFCGFVGGALLWLGIIIKD